MVLSLTFNSGSKEKCYHESRIQYCEFENEDTGEVVSMDFEVCKDCNAVILNDKIMGYAP